jgi:hypothetical protein
MSTITKKFRLDGVLTNMTSVVLSSADGAYGVKRNDTGAVVVIDGVAMTNVSPGVYSHVFADPALGLTYTCAVEVTCGGEIYRFTDTLVGPPLGVGSHYASDAGKLWFAAAKRRGETESVSYLAAPGGVAKVIDALVSRRPPEDFLSGAAPMITVLLLNDAALGVEASALDVRLGTIAMSERLGGTPAARGIHRLLRQTDDVLELLLR